MNSPTPSKVQPSSTTDANIFLKELMTFAKPRTGDGWRFRNLGLVIALPGLAFGLMILSSRPRVQETARLPQATESASLRPNVAPSFKNSSGERGQWKLLHQELSVHASGVDPIFFGSSEGGWALTWATLSRISEKGKLWTPVLTNEESITAFYSFTFNSPETGFVVGTQKKGDEYNVLILKTSDGGQRWEETPTSVRSERDRHKMPALLSVSFCDQKIGWAVGDGLILHTTDGGESWQEQESKLSSGERLLAVACVDRERASAVGRDGLVLRTSNGGQTWTHQDLGVKEPLIKVRFYGDDGWIVGGSVGKGLLFKTNDGGTTWQSKQPADSVGLLFDVFFSGSHGWIAGEKGMLMSSEDAGQTWQQEHVPTAENLTSLFFLSASEGWAAGEKETLLHFRTNH